MGLEAMMPAQEALLREIDGALAAPVWPIFLGRKRYVPSVPVRLPDALPVGPGLHEGSLEDVLKAYPWDGAPEGQSVMTVIECARDDKDAEPRDDQPLTFESARRSFATRYVAVGFMERPAMETSGVETAATEGE